MTYDPYGEYRRREAEILRQADQRFWDGVHRDLRELGNPSRPPASGEASTGLIRFLLLLVLSPVIFAVFAARLSWHGDIARPWSRFRKIAGMGAVVGSAIGWAWYWLLPAVDGGLGWVLGFLATILLVIVAAPRTALVFGMLIGMLGVYVEFFAS